MLEALSHAAIVLNHHGDVGDHANNYRLYEATGCGALLITDMKSDLAEMFDVGRELVAYTNAEECARQVERYLSDVSASRKIAEAGRERTLREHTFTDRMRDLLSLIEDRR